MKMLRYFKLSEFDSPDEKGSGALMQSTTLELLEKTRQKAGVPFVITSGYRSPAHNRKVGGVSSSSHLSGHAVDIRCARSSDRFKIIAAALAAGFNRIGVSGRFLHLDNDPKKPKNVIWTY